MLFNISQRYVFNPELSLLIDNLNDNAEIKLNKNENKILLLLSQRPNQVVSRDELQNHVWLNEGIVVHGSSLTQAMSTLRKALGDTIKAPEYIMTVPKKGYRFVANVVDITPSEEPKIEKPDGRTKKSRLSKFSPSTFSFQNLLLRMTFAASMCICLYVMVH